MKYPVKQNALPCLLPYIQHLINLTAFAAERRAAKAARLVGFGSYTIAAVMMAIL